jgi:vitamin B12 transporter
MRKNAILGLGCLMMTLSSFAQDSLKTVTLQEVVVTGTRFELPVEKSGKIIFNVKRSDVQSHASLFSAINAIPGMHVDGTFNTPGTNLSYFTRGGRSKSTLVLLDGVPMSDPTGIDPFYDLRFIAPSQLETIEVLQGGLSTLYGSGASAAIINIQTRKPASDGVHGSVAANFGSWNSFGQNFSLSGKRNKLSFLLLGNRYKTDGFSAALDEDNTGYDEDGFKQKNGLLKFGYQIKDNIHVTAYVGYDWFNTAFDAGAFMDSDDENKQNQQRVGLTAEWNFNKGKLTYLGQYTKNEREYTGSFPSVYKGGNAYSELTYQHQLLDQLTLLSGLSFQQLSYDEKQVLNKDTANFTIVDPYVSFLYSIPSGLTLHAGARLNTHSKYGSKMIYNVNPSWLLTINQNLKLKVLASASTAFITPTLFQLYTPWGGNKDLKPEESENFEYGFTVYLTKKAELTAVHYFRNESQVIGYTANFEYDNVADKRSVKGLTLAGRYTPLEVLTVKADFNWVTSTDKASFIRIPAKKVNAQITGKVAKTWQVSLWYQYTSSRDDIYFDESFTLIPVQLKPYHLFDVHVSKSFIKEKLRVHGSVFNIFDQEYIGVYGYTTRDRNFIAGVTYQF